MRLDNLKPETKLMWDSGNHVYPALVGHKDKWRKLVMVYAGNSSSSRGWWMGYEEEYLRLPTEHELKTLQWPEMKNYI